MESSRLIWLHDAMYGVNRKWTWGAVFFSLDRCVRSLVNEPSSRASRKSHDFYFDLKFVSRGSVHDLLRWTKIEVTSCGVSRKSTNSRFLLFSTLDETVFRRSKSKILEVLMTSRGMVPAVNYSQLCIYASCVAINQEEKIVLNDF